MALEEYKYNNMNDNVTRNRLLKLKDHSKKLAHLKAQLISIKNAGSLRNIGEICAICIIEHEQIVFTFFIDDETELAFSFLKHNFESKCINIYQHYHKNNSNSNNVNSSEALYEIFNLIDITFTLFIKSLHIDKYLIFLMKGKENINEIKSYGLLDLIQTIINNICFSLQIKNRKNNKKTDCISTQTALIEIANEIFFGVYDQSSDESRDILNTEKDEHELDKIEFTMAMSIRLGLKWKKNDLTDLFHKIIANVQENATYLYIGFNDLVQYFVGNIHDKNILNQWKQIKNAINMSPLSKRNKILRDKNNISVLKIKDKLMHIEKMVNLLEEILIVNQENENEIYWRNKLLKHREIIRLFQDSILTQILKENNKMKEKYNTLMKIKSIKNNNYDNNHLKDIETKYYCLLKKKRNDEKTMKKVEILIKQKNNEIYRLKSELMSYKQFSPATIKSAPNNLNSRNEREENKEEIVNNGLLQLKTEIVEKKLNVQKELDLLRTASMEHSDNDFTMLNIRT